MSTKDERRYITAKLMPEIRQAFKLWAKEYQQERDLGKLGEFANLYRKARKLKTLIWDKKGVAQPEGWRETERTIVMEVIAHGLLMLTDLDKENGDFERWTKKDKEDWDDDEDDEEEFTPQGKRTNAEAVRESRLRARRRGRGVTPPPSSPIITS